MAGNREEPGTSRSWRVLYPFAGFFSPVDNQPTLNVAKAGSAIPLKFSLGGTGASASSPSARRRRSR